MSMDFTVALAGPDAAIGATLERIEERLHVAGFTRNGGVLRAELDRERGVFDELDVDEELEGFEAVAEVRAELDAWTGAAVEFLAPAVGILYLILGRTPKHQLNAWVDLSERHFRQLAEDGELTAYYAGVNAIARGCGALLGLGDLELAFEPVDPEQLRARMAESPEQRSPAQLFILPATSVGPDEVETRWGPGARGRRFVDGYLFVETAEYQDFWAG